MRGEWGRKGRTDYCQGSDFGWGRLGCIYRRNLTGNESLKGQRKEKLDGGGPEEAEDEAVRKGK